MKARFSPMSNLEPEQVKQAESAPSSPENAPESAEKKEESALYYTKWHRGTGNWIFILSI